MFSLRLHWQYRTPPHSSPPPFLIARLCESHRTGRTSMKSLSVFVGNSRSPGTNRLVGRGFSHDKKRRAQRLPMRCSYCSK
jgi:hypothetical protein